MSKIEAYYDKKRQIEQLTKDLELLESDPGLKKEFEARDKLKELMDKYNMSSAKVLDVLQKIDPALNVKTGQRKKGTRAPRKEMRYTNPHTGEVVVTKGGNHKTLKEWRDKYGTEEVNKWKESNE